MTVTSTNLDAFTPAHAMLAALQAGRISSAELVELHLGRIAQFNPTLKAIVVHTDDPLRVAREADEGRREGNDRPLLGLPVTVKESMNVPGMPTTVGVKDFANFRAADTGAIPRKVLGAGAVLLGKTNIAPMLGDWQSDNPVYGRTVNPWNADLTPGGMWGMVSRLRYSGKHRRARTPRPKVYPDGPRRPSGRRRRLRTPCQFHFLRTASVDVNGASRVGSPPGAVAAV